MDTLELEIGSKLQNRLVMLSKDPGNKALRASCLEISLAEQNYNVALQIADEALEKDPLDSHSKFARASALIGLKRIEDALSVLCSLEEPGLVTHPAVLQNIGLYYYMLGDYSAASAKLYRVYDNGIRSGDLYRLLISTLHHLGDVSAALKIADTAREYAINDEALAGVMGLLYLDANQPQKAAQWSARAFRP